MYEWELFGAPTTTSCAADKEKGGNNGSPFCVLLEFDFMEWHSSKSRKGGGRRGAREYDRICRCPVWCTDPRPLHDVHKKFSRYNMYHGNYTVSDPSDNLRAGSFLNPVGLKSWELLKSDDHDPFKVLSQHSTRFKSWDVRRKFRVVFHGSRPVYTVMIKDKGWDTYFKVHQHGLPRSRKRGYWLVSFQDFFSQHAWKYERRWKERSRTRRTSEWRQGARLLRSWAPVWTRIGKREAP